MKPVKIIRSYYLPVRFGILDYIRGKFNFSIGAFGRVVFINVGENKTYIQDSVGGIVSHVREATKQKTYRSVEE